MLKVQVVMRPFWPTWLVALLVAAPLFGAGPWKKKSYTTWTKREVLRVLTDSPWARPQSFGAGVGDVVLWSSSRTVREGLARYQQLDRNEASTPELPYTPPDQYRVTLYRPDEISLLDHQQLKYGRVFKTTGGEELVQNAAFLQGKKGKARVSPIHVDLIRRGTWVMEAAFYFPREQNAKPTLDPDEQGVAFNLNLSGYHVRAYFDLRKMVRDGRPDL